MGHGGLGRLDLPPVWGAAAWAAIWGLAQVGPVLPLPAALVPVGAALMAGGVGFGLWALAQFRGRDTPVEPKKTPRALVTSGPYRLTRNPMYRGLIWVTLGLALLNREGLGLLVAAGYAWVLHRRFAVPEERTLERVFGDDFRDWAAQVRARL